MPSFDRRPVLLYGVLLALGVVLGGVLLAVTDETSAGAGVATANWIHVGLAAAALTALAVAWRRDRAAFLRHPFTAAGWADLTSAFRWRDRPVPLRPVAFLAALVLAYTPVRAGLQVLAGLDPDFTRDAWGGPTYLGAAAAHWLDGALIFLACTALLRVQSRTTMPRHISSVVPSPHTT